MAQGRIESLLPGSPRADSRLGGGRALQLCRACGRERLARVALRPCRYFCGQRFVFKLAAFVGRFSYWPSNPRVPPRMDAGHLSISRLRTMSFNFGLFLFVVSMPLMFLVILLQERRPEIAERTKSKE